MCVSKQKNLPPQRPQEKLLIPAGFRPDSGRIPAGTLCVVLFVCFFIEPSFPVPPPTVRYLIPPQNNTGFRPGSGRDPAGIRPELKAFLEASGAADFVFVEKARSWNFEHAKVSKSVKMHENS